MTLRKHQAEMQALASRIAAGADIREIFAAVTPGGGKSALPPILARELLGAVADSIIWVVPRNSLRDQGEADFSAWDRGHTIRAAGNFGDPFRGCSGYITTYQAIVADPDFHRRAFRGRRPILFLDEPHHRLAGGPWDSAIAPLVKAAALVVYASGTFARGDGQPIAGLHYLDDGTPDLSDASGRAVIRYSRGDALREGAIVPVAFEYLDGRTEWEDEDGQRRSADSLAGGDYAPQALFTALRTGYAFDLLEEAVASWREERREFPGAKLLVVAPNIQLSGIYSEHLSHRRIDNLIATSADDARAREAIARFKGLALPSCDALVSVAMAYEGLSVPAITHIACLTHIRSIPWLEQCFARANRTAPGKRRGVIFGPNDGRFREAISAIEAEQIQALQEREEERGDSLDEAEGAGGGRRWIQPLHSEAIRDGIAELEFAEPTEPNGGLPTSQAEKLLRKEIARHIEIILGRARPGSKQAYSTIIYRTLKDLVRGKAREECTVEELTAQWAELKRRWPV